MIMPPYIQRHNTLWLIRLSIRSMLQFYHKKNRKANINYIFFIKVYLSIPFQVRLNRLNTKNPVFFQKSVAECHTKPPCIQTSQAGNLQVSKSILKYTFEKIS